MIPTVDCVATTVTVAVGDGFLDVEIDYQLEVTLALGKPGSFFATIRAPEIYNNRYVSICASVIGDC